MVAKTLKKQLKLTNHREGNEHFPAHTVGEFEQTNLANKRTVEQLETWLTGPGEWGGGELPGPSSLPSQHPHWTYTSHLREPV